MSKVPDESTVRAAVSLAARAPSIHNSQPWQWRLADSSVHLFADTSRLLPATDPDGRDLLISCGATLHHLRVALAAEGWATTVTRLPNPSQPDHLAAICFHQQTPSAEDIALASAIPQRRTDRRRFSSWSVPPNLLDDLTKLATEQGAVMIPATDPNDRFTLALAITEASLRQEDNPDYASELATWAGRSSLAVDGVPASNIPAHETHHDDTTMRAFPHGVLTQPPAGDQNDAAELLVLATATDEPVSRLRAGEAMSAVLLSATALRLATCPVSQVLEIEATRELVRTRVLDGFGFPQIVLRIGWAPTENPPLPATPRRALAEVLEHFPDACPS
jgi:nitroreductase